MTLKWVRRNEKNSGGVPILRYCRPRWLAEEENFSFQIIKG